jgi:hypothetical protein
MLDWRLAICAIRHAILKVSARKDYMTATGELIRMMNYVDDIAATLRRINASLYLITPEEKRKLAEYMRKSDPNFFNVIEALEKGGA